MSVIAACAIFSVSKGTLSERFQFCIRIASRLSPHISDCSRALLICFAFVVHLGWVSFFVIVIYW